MVGRDDPWSSLVVCGSWASLGFSVQTGIAYSPSRLPPPLRRPGPHSPHFSLPSTSGGKGGQDRVATGAPCAGQELLFKAVADITPLLAGRLVVGSCGFWQGQSGLGSLWPWRMAQPPKPLLCLTKSIVSPTLGQSEGHSDQNSALDVNTIS